MTGDQEFLGELAHQIVVAGGSSTFSPEKAMETATEVLRRLREIGPFAYPSLLDAEGLRFVYDWEAEPPVLLIMWWDDVMWRDMARFPVPAGLVE